MGSRRHNRYKMVLPIRIWGMDATGAPFNDLAYTLDISQTGARIGGMRKNLAVGEAVTIQFKQARALFKVAWIGRPGDKTKDQVGVVALEADRNIWVDLPQEKQFTDNAPIAGRAREPVPPPPPPQPPPPAPERELDPASVVMESEEAPAPEPETALANPDELLRSCSRTLREINSVVRVRPPSAESLHDFREAISLARQTVWALQQWMQTRQETATPFPLLSFLNTERLRFVVQAVGDLKEDAVARNVELDDALLRQLFQSVEEFAALTKTRWSKEGQIDLTRETDQALSAASPALAGVQKIRRDVVRSAMPLQQALDYFASQLHSLFSADGVAIAISKEKEMVYVSGIGNAPERGLAMDVETGLGLEAFASARLAYCRDTSSDARVDADLCREANIRAVVMQPVHSGDERPVAMIEMTFGAANPLSQEQLAAVLRAAEELYHVLTNVVVPLSGGTSTSA